MGTNVIATLKLRYLLKGLIPFLENETKRTNPPEKQTMGIDPHIKSLCLKKRGIDPNINKFEYRD